MYSTRNKSQGASSSRRRSLSTLKPAGSTKGIGVTSLKKNNKMLAIALEETRSELNAYRKTLDESSKCLSQFKFARSKMLQMNSVLKSFVQEFEEVLFILNFDDSELFQTKPPSHTHRTFKDQIDKIADLPVTSEEPSIHEELESEPVVSKNENAVEGVPSSSAKEICSQTESIPSSSKSLISSSEASKDFIDVKEAETNEKILQSSSPVKTSEVGKLESSASHLEIGTKIGLSATHGLHPNILSPTKNIEKPPSSMTLHKSKIPKVTGIPVCSAKKNKSNVLKFLSKKKLSDERKLIKTGTENSGADHSRRKTFVVKESNSKPTDMEQSSNSSKSEGNATPKNSDQMTASVINEDRNKNITADSASADTVETQKDTQKFKDTDSIGIAEAQTGLQMFANGPHSDHFRRKTFVLTQKFTDSDSVGIAEAQKDLQMLISGLDSDHCRRKTFVLKELSSDPADVQESGRKPEEKGNSDKHSSAVINEDLNRTLTIDLNAPDVADAQREVQKFTNPDQLTAANMNENLNKNLTADSDSADIAEAQSSQMFANTPKTGIQSPSKVISSTVSPKMNAFAKIQKTASPVVNDHCIETQISEGAVNYTEEMENLNLKNQLTHFTGAISKHKCSDNIFIDSCNKKQKVQSNSTRELKAKKKKGKKISTVDKDTENYSPGTSKKDIRVDVLHRVKKTRFPKSATPRKILDNVDFDAITQDIDKKARKKKTKRAKEKTCSEYSKNVSPGVSNNKPDKINEVEKQGIKRKKYVSRDNKDSPYEMTVKNSIIVQAEIHHPPPHILSFDDEIENQENCVVYEEGKYEDKKKLIPNKNIKNIENVDKENKQLAGMKDLQVVLHDFRKSQNADYSNVPNVVEPTAVDTDLPVKSPLLDSSLNIQKLPDKNSENVMISKGSHLSKQLDIDYSKVSYLKELPTNGGGLAEKFPLSENSSNIPQVSDRNFDNIVVSKESRMKKSHDNDYSKISNLKEVTSNDPGLSVESSTKSKENRANEITLGKRRRNPVNYKIPKLNAKMRR